MTPQIRHLISKKDRLLGENGAGVIIDEQVSYPGRPAQKKLLQPEKLSGDGRDIACTTQVVQGLAPSASTMPAGGMRAASRQRYRSPRRRLTRCH